MNRVSDGDRSTLLSFVSCGASQGYAPQSGEIIGFLTVLFRSVGIGTRLALTSMGWLTVHEFVILVPDPIAFVPGWSEPCDICQRTSSRPPFAGLFVTPRNKDDMGDGVPQTNCRTTTATVLTATATVTLSLRACLWFLLSHLLSQVHRRQTPPTTSSSSGRASLVSSVKTYLTNLPSQGRQLRTSKSDVYQQPIAGLFPESSRVKEDPLVEETKCLFLCHTPITKPAACASGRRCAGRSRRTSSPSSQDSHIDFFVRPCEQAIIAAAGRRLFMMQDGCTLYSQSELVHMRVQQLGVRRFLDPA